MLKAKPIDINGVVTMGSRDSNQTYYVFESFGNTARAASKETSGVVEVQVMNLAPRQRSCP